ncbi:hypothetical protein CSV71_14825 [Sporosarcina sp. P21c]|uniref:helix-turn-helix transcriptional regulator n=1 Tax=Sporosarcina sp. P21c TaxID=2048255 RepID=UPI000C16B5BC|nr:helix-turn-helix domain-containing protein [Sporosarcina sp. P21c]PIC88400.1 hypothetical protein CSV71_14825 [Sporosarcina sp. P21c]
MQKLRRVRGAKNLSDYLDSVGCPMSESTIYRLMKEKRIPHMKPSAGILLFSLDSIDSWLDNMEEML